MKTFAETMAERNENYRAFREEADRQRAELLAKAELVQEVYQHPDPKVNRTHYDQVRDEVRQGIRLGRYDPVGVACDHCSTQLVSDGNINMSNPPSQTVRCAGCGWMGYLRY